MQANLTSPALTAYSPFDYSVLPAVHRDQVRSIARQVKILAFRSARDIVESGKLLIEAWKTMESCVKRTTFNQWCIEEFPWSRSHSYRLIKAAEVFGPLLGTVERIEVTALYMLTRSDVKEEIRSYVLEISKERVVTAADAREILSATRGQPEPTKREVIQYEKTVEDILDDESPEPVGPWATFEQLVASATMIHISRSGDDDDLILVTVYREDDRPRRVVNTSLVQAIEAAADGEPERQCPTCEETKKLTAFCVNSRMPDGRNRICKRCECERQKKIKLKKKRRKRRAKPS
jgi:hypothetical protein